METTTGVRVGRSDIKRGRAMLATKWRLGMTGVCGMKKVGHTSIQCLRALDAP